MSRDLVLGLDGGGTKTVVALVARDGTLAALRQGPGLDPYGNADWRRDLGDMVAGVGTGQGGLERAALGLSCHTETADISAAQTDCAKELFAVPVDVLNDVHVAFEGALAGQAGVLALAGTGSMTWAGDGQGLHRRCGGWGDIVGDEGSAYWLGREALTETTRVLDGRSPTTRFAEGLLAGIGIGGGDLLAWTFGLRQRRTGIAALARIVDRLAEAGDPTAIQLLKRAADHLVEQVETAWRLVGSPGPLVWSYAGGLFASGEFRRHLAERLGPARAPELPPVGGAVLEAARRAGWSTDRAWRARLAESLAHGIRSGGTPDLSRQGWTA
ncbi:MAG: N-acetylglucosamine kinase [Janthinobacterium lividum]